VTSNTPFEEVLAPHAKIPSSLAHFLSYALIPFSALILPKHYHEVTFAKQCERIKTALETGDTLYLALSKHARFYLTLSTLSAIKEAERDDHLAETLAILAAKPPPVMAAGPLSLAMGHFAFIFALILVFGRSVARLPRLLQTETPQGFFVTACAKMAGWINATSVYQAATIGLVLALVVALTGFFLQSRFRSRFVILAFTRRAQIDREVSLGIACVLRSGRDIVEAIEWTTATCQSSRMRTRLGRCADDIRKGHSWHSAWREHCEPAFRNEIAAWIVAAQPDPIKAFEARARWLAEGEQRSQRSFAVKVRLLSTAVCAIIVGGIAIDAFRLLVNIIYVSMP
jgi:hypothetical protein